MLMDFIWKVFEKTGDMRYYLGYIEYRDIYNESKSTKENDRMDKTG